MRRALAVTVNPEVYADGTSYCHREYPFRPDVKVLGSYTLPLDIVSQRHVSVQPRRADRRRRTCHPGDVDRRRRAQFASPTVSTLGRALNAGSPTKSIAADA